MYQKYGKRFLDLVVSSAGLFFFFPLFIITAIFIKWDSSGPIFFRQLRMGKNNNLFNIYKFRSMRGNENEERQHFTPGNYKRITKTGRFIRKTKFDELPQLINVLKGEMSLVGPRPEVPRYRNMYRGEYERILDVLPGITDLSSIRYRDEEKLLHVSNNPGQLYTEKILPEKLRLSLEYVDKISFKMDMTIIVQTLLKVFFPRL